MRTPEEQINRMLEVADSSVPVLYRSFRNILDEIRNDIFDEEAVEEFLEKEDVDKVIEASGILELDPMMFGSGMDEEEPSFVMQLQTLFSLGALIAISNLDGLLSKRTSFDPLGERAVYFQRYTASILAVETLFNSSEGLRLAISHYLSTAKDKGGLANILREHVGLTPQQSQALINFHNQLENRKRLGFTSPSDRKLSESDQLLVSRHMSGELLTRAQIDALVSRYADNLLDKRISDMVRTQSLRWVNSGQQEAWNQAIDQGALDDDTIRKFWFTMGDAKVRPTHRPIPSMNPFGVKVKSHFVTPFGPVMGPGDYNAGLINCRCGVVLRSIV